MFVPLVIIPQVEIFFDISLDPRVNSNHIHMNIASISSEIQFGTCEHMPPPPEQNILKWQKMWLIHLDILCAFKVLYQKYLRTRFDFLLNLILEIIQVFCVLPYAKFDLESYSDRL